jgi:hypothetical protein
MKEVAMRKLTGILSLVFILSVILNSFSCTNQKVDPQYKQEIDSWHQKRIASLKRPEGWLSLVGLYWLEEGENSFGSDSKNAIVFPESFPAYCGKFILKDSVVSISLRPDVDIKIEHSDKKEAILEHDLTGHPTKMWYKSYVWYVIKRGPKYGIRVKDTLNSLRLNFKGIDRFPVNPEYRVKAKFIPYHPPKKIVIPTIIGTEEIDFSPGALEFEIKGKTFRLDPVGSMKDKEWFIVFGDATNGKSTYGAGRFLYIPVPDSSGITVIDFNKAYNPPCAFTPYATCPLPPEQNILPIEIKAGEKKYGNHH